MIQLINKKFFGLVAILVSFSFAACDEDYSTMTSDLDINSNESGINGVIDDIESESGAQRLDARELMPVNAGDESTQALDIVTPMKSLFGYSFADSLSKDVNRDDLIYFNPLDGMPYQIDGSSNQYRWTDNSGYMIPSHRGHYNDWGTEPMMYGNGIHVYQRGCRSGQRQTVDIFPFAEFEKQNSSYDWNTGTVSFLARTIGGWRGKGADTYIDSEVYFQLSEDIKVRLLGRAKRDYSKVYISYGGESREIATISNGSLFTQIVLQWNFDDETADGNFLKVFVNGHLAFEKQISNGNALADRGACGSYLQKFRLRSWVENDGQEKPSMTHADIDHIQIYKDIKAPSELMVDLTDNCPEYCYFVEDEASEEETL